MSGGSLNYFYHEAEHQAATIADRATKPLHRAFAARLRLVAKALRDLEKVWSDDMSPGDEDAAIRRVVSRGDEIAAAREDLERAVADARAVLDGLSDAQDADSRALSDRGAVGTGGKDAEAE